MISKELAQEKLKTFYNANSLKEQVARLQKLSTQVSKTGQILIQAGPEWDKLEKSQAQSYTWRREPREHVGALKPKDRQALFKALFPGTSALIEETWNLFDRFPYQTGYVRRPFRNPGYAGMEARTAWVGSFTRFITGYENQTVTWLAAWAPHLASLFSSDTPGYLFAAAIDQGGKTGDEVFNILISSANGTHETGAMGRHVVKGLLCSSRTDGWEYIERMLLAAQREEGLRQSILEAVDESHPRAFQRILRVVVDHNLVRFSAAMRAFNVWFGLPFDAVNPKITNGVLNQVLQYLDSHSECEKALQGGDPQNAYYALWSIAYEDVKKALPYAVKLCHSPDVEKRFAATHMLAQMKLKQGLPELLRLLEDEDLRIVARVLMDLTSWEYDAAALSASDLFERLERLLPRVKAKLNHLKPLVWDWLPITMDRETIAGKMIDCIGTRSVKRLVPYLSLMRSWDRGRVAKLLAESKQKDEANLQTLLLLAADPSRDVRENALKGLHGIPLGESNLLELEHLLSRQAQDLRRGIIQLLLELPDKKLLASISRLLSSKVEKQRLAALELLKECKQAGRLSQQAGEAALEYKKRADLSNDEIRLLDEILVQSVEKYTLEDALGLADLSNCTKPTPPDFQRLKQLFSKRKLVGNETLASLRSLDDFVELHRNDVILIDRGQSKSTELLGNIRWASMLYPGQSQADHFSDFKLKELAESWWRDRRESVHDQHPHHLIEAWMAIQLFHSPYSFRFSKVDGAVPRDLQAFFGFKLNFNLKYFEIIRSIIEWLVWANPSKDDVDFILDSLEDTLGRIPHSELTGLKQEYGGRQVRALTNYDHRLVFLGMARSHRNFHSDLWKPEQHARLWGMVHWLNEPKPKLSGDFIKLEDALFAFQSGASTRDDLFRLFLKPPEHTGYYGGNYGLLRSYSSQKPHARLLPTYNKFPVIQEIVNTCRERILDVECRRGELPTAATDPAMSIRSVPGVKNLFRMLNALGETGFARGYMYGQSRSGVFSHLIRNSYPLKEDTFKDFADQVTLHRIPQTRLIELAVYAPQWVEFVQDAIGWDHLTEAVWWLYAHTKDRQWTVEQDIREEWKVGISERTPLSADDLMDGAVDVAWFHQVYSQLGEERWRQLYDAALYTSGGIGHTRARLYADAMLGNVTSAQVAERIKNKRHQDSVRSLGLIALGSRKNHKNEILSRYEVLQEFLRGSRKFGSQRQASERLAVSIGMQNLARTAGYVDPQRLEWAMEIEAIADLSKGPVNLIVDDYQFTLRINELGEPIFETRKKDRGIKTIPAALKKNERVAALLERKQKLDRQVSRMRLSLEQAMCRGSEFTPAELKKLLQHPMLKAMLEQLIFVSPRGLGYPGKSAASLLSHNGKQILLKQTDPLRIAHPVDLLKSRQWHRWQHECFISERIQPFKQVFRELYVLTSTEEDEGNLSRRYAGQQVNPRQAVALFGARGWVADPDQGIRKTFHELGISARVGFLEGAFTPLEMEGLTIETIAFTKRGEWDAIKLKDIPSRVFSEVMRDLDLVVSVAHAGGVDPEASASSLEARTALIRESCTLLKIKNVQLAERHVLIDGKLANYNVNLGSGVVHKQPGGALCIIPVHSQHRGRIFLPFVDNDPKTAEIVSKVILLARDDQIKDPTILEQIL
jgi:HEAT repeat protein